MSVYEHIPALDIVHGAFISSSEIIVKTSADVSTTLCNLKEPEVDAVASVICKSICTAANVWDRKTSSVEISVLQKIHAAIFYRVLQASKISCPSADEYYEVVNSYLLDLDWKLYLKIIANSPLSQHFIDCLLQLPEHVALVLLKRTMAEVQRREENFLDLLNPVLHTLTHMLFGFHHQKHTSLDNISFRFDFEISEDCNALTEDKGSDQDEDIKSLSTEVLQFLQEIQETTELTELLLDWAVSLINCFCEKENICKFLDESQEIANFCSFFVEYFSTERTLSALRDSLNSFSLEKFKSVTRSCRDFNAHPGYSLHLLFAKWRTFHSKACCEGQSNAVIVKMEKCIEELYSLHPLRMRNDESILNTYLKMLIHIVNARLDGMDYTSEMLLWDLDFRNEEEVLSCITENLGVYMQSFQKMNLLMNSAVDQRQSSSQTKLAEIFLAAYGKLPPFTQSALLQVFLKEWQPKRILRMPTYENDFSFAFHQDLDMDKLIQLIFPLCIQSPMETLQKIVGNAVNYGPNFCDAPQILKRLDVLCSSKKVENSKLQSALWKVLDMYCFQNYENSKKENLLLLVKGILKEFRSSTAIPIAGFVCDILSHVQPLSGKKTEFSLQLLNLCLIHTIEENDTDWVTTFPLLAVVILLCQLISSCITSLNGCLKEQVITSLENVLKLYKAEPMDFAKLHSELSGLHPFSQFYVWDHLHLTNTDFSSWCPEGLLCWWVVQHEKDPDIIVRCISQKRGVDQSSALTVVLLQLFPHFTCEEFRHLPHLFEAPFFHSQVRKPAVWLEQEENKEVLNKKLQVISMTEICVDVFILLNLSKEPRLDWNYMLNSFMNVTKECLASAPTCPLTCSKVFLEFCRLIDSMQNHFDVLNMILHYILNELKSYSGDHSEEKMVCKKLLLAATHALPDEKERSDLLSLF